MSFGVTELLIILAIVALLFGTRKLRTLGGDVGGAIKSFRAAMTDGDDGKDDNGKSEDAGPVTDSGPEKH